MNEDVFTKLPADLVSLLRDQSILVPQDAAVFELIAAWTRAPTTTATAEIAASLDMSVVDALHRQTRAAITPGAC